MRCSGPAAQCRPGRSVGTHPARWCARLPPRRHPCGRRNGCFRRSRATGPRARASRRSPSRSHRARWRQARTAAGRCGSAWRSFPGGRSQAIASILPDGTWWSCASPPVCSVRLIQFHPGGARFPRGSRKRGRLTGRRRVAGSRRRRRCRFAKAPQAWRSWPWQARLAFRPFLSWFVLSTGGLQTAMSN